MGMRDAGATSFASQLRRLRQEAALSQEELAERAGLTAKGISALERGERRNPYPQTVRALADALGLSGPERDRLIAAARQRTEAEPASTDAPARTATGAAPTGLATMSTAVTSLPTWPLPVIGREREAATLADLLDEVRLLTLTGPGGVGKTRLAVEVATRVGPRYRDGIVFVPLAPLSDPALVLPTITRLLGLQESSEQAPREALRAALQARHLLLVIDNVEHLLDIAPDLAELLRACPDLVMLVTSRAPLRVQGEHEFHVGPLALPAPIWSSEPREIAGTAAVQLFVRRARQVAHTFELTAANAAAVAAICRRLDGLPLALELAAARTKLLPPATLLARLDQALPLLSAGSRDLPERQRTMAATLGWSYDLLAPAEQALFRSLAVFAGGWRLEEAEAMCATGEVAGHDGLELLSRLLEQSLVVAEVPLDAEGGRYRLLEPVRQYAFQRLEERGEAALARRRHAEIFLALAERACPELRGARQVEWLARLDREHDNLRAALTWALEHGDAEVAARLGWSLWEFWWIRGYQREGRQWMEAVLALREHLALPTLIRAVMAAEAMAYGQGDGEAVIRFADALMTLSHQVGGHAHAESYARSGYGLVATVRGDFATALKELELARVLLRESGEAGMASQASTWIGTVLLLQGQHDAAAAHFEQGLADGRAVGDRLGICNALFNLAQLALSQGDAARAGRLFAEGITPSSEMGDRPNIAFILEGLGVVAGMSGRAELAARLFGAAEGLFEAVGLRGHTYYRPDRALYARVAAAAHAALGPALFGAEHAAGRALTPAEAIAEATAPRDDA